MIPSCQSRGWESICHSLLRLTLGQGVGKPWFQRCDRPPGVSVGKREWVGKERVGPWPTPPTAWFFPGALLRDHSIPGVILRQTPNVSAIIIGPILQMRKLRFREEEGILCCSSQNNDPVSPKMPIPSSPGTSLNVWSVSMWPVNMWHYMVKGLWKCH